MSFAHSHYFRALSSPRRSVKTTLTASTARVQNDRNTDCTDHSNSNGNSNGNSKGNGNGNGNGNSNDNSNGNNDNSSHSGIMCYARSWRLTKGTGAFSSPATALSNPSPRAAVAAVPLHSQAASTQRWWGFGALWWS